MTRTHLSIVWGWLLFALCTVLALTYLVQQAWVMFVTMTIIAALLFANERTNAGRAR